MLTDEQAVEILDLTTKSVEPETEWEVRYGLDGDPELGSTKELIAQVREIAEREEEDFQSEIDAPQAEIVAVFDQLSVYLMKGDFEFIDNWISEIDTAESNLTVMLAILKGTARVETFKLPSRKKFW